MGVDPTTDTIRTVSVQVRGRVSIPYVLSSLWLIELSVQVIDPCRRACTPNRIYSIRLPVQLGEYIVFRLYGVRKCHVMSSLTIVP